MTKKTLKIRVTPIVLSPKDYVYVFSIFGEYSDTGEFVKFNSFSDLNEIKDEYDIQIDYAGLDTTIKQLSEKTKVKEEDANILDVSSFLNV